MVTPELLMPAGNLSKLRIALVYGADAVYVGAAGLSMRPDEASFDINSLVEGIEFTHSMKKKIYVGVNAMFFPEDMLFLRDWLKSTRNLSFDGIIIADTGAFKIIKELRPELKIHISTQMSIANTDAAKFWKEQGASRIVLARECTLAHAQEITSKSSIETEIFVHGAMCVAISGRCLLSAHLCGQNGSKGVCKHSCRWKWDIVEEKRPNEKMTVIETNRETIFFGSKDLCLIDHIPQIIESGITSLKVEGRMKSEHYVATVARVYRDALDSYIADPGKYRFKQEWRSELETISHRPYSTGFAFGYNVKEETLQTNNKLISTCRLLGFIKGNMREIHTVSVKNSFNVGEELEWIGPPEQGSVRGNLAGRKVRVKNIYNNKEESIEQSHCGTIEYVSFEGDVILPEYAVLRSCF